MNSKLLLIVTDGDDSPDRLGPFSDFDKLWAAILEQEYDVYTDEDSKNKLKSEHWLPGEDGQRRLLIIDLSDY